MFFSGLPCDYKYLLLFLKYFHSSNSILQRILFKAFCVKYSHEWTCNSNKSMTGCPSSKYGMDPDVDLGARPLYGA